METPQGTCLFFLDIEMVDRTQQKQLFGIFVPVIPVENNILAKAIWQIGAIEGKHDIDDIKDMVRSNKIDLEYLQKRIRKCHAEKRVKPILQPLFPNMTTN